MNMHVSLQYSLLFKRLTTKAGRMKNLSRIVNMSMRASVQVSHLSESLATNVIRSIGMQVSVQ